MRRMRAETGGLTLDHLFEFETEESTSEMDKNLLKEFTLGEKSKLKPREKEILKCYFWKGMKFKLIAEKMRLSSSRIGQLHAKAMHKLRFYLLSCDRILAGKQRKLDKEKSKKRDYEKEAEKQEKEAEKQAEYDAQLEKEKDLSCPDYLFLKRDLKGELCLELPMEYASQFRSVMTATYKRWLEEKSNDPKALKELEEDEMEFGKTKDK